LVGKLSRGPLNTVTQGCCLYGKLPGHGDFVSRGLERAREIAVDTALTASLDSARAQWGLDFSETYTAAQPWLFASSSAAAIIIPSADKVGRNFPLFVAANRPIILQLVYDAAVYAIAGALDADHLLQTVSEAAERSEGPSQEPEGRWFCIDSDAPRLPMRWDEDRMIPGESAT